MNQKTRVLGIVFALTGAWEVGHAQTVPPAVLPGRIEQDIKKEPVPTTRNESIQIDRSRFPEQMPAGAQETRLVLSGIALSGNSVLTSAQLQPLWAPLVGREVTLADVFQVAARISAAYRERGYVLSQAIVPQQDLQAAGATVRIDVLEGYIDGVSFVGIEEPRLRAFFEPVLAEKPLRLATLERSLLLVNELAGVTVQANLKAGALPNASSLTVVAARTPATFSLSVHNRSTPALGRVRIEAGADLFGLVGRLDHHGLRAISSGDERLKYIGYAFDMPLGARGLKLQFNASASRSKPTSTLGNIDTSSDNLGIGLTYPIVRSRQANLTARAGFAGYNNSYDSVLTTASREDRIRSLRVGVSADYADAAAGISVLDAELSKGLSMLGASRSRPDELADPQFSKLSLYLARLQHLGGEWSLLLAATAQYSRDPLPTAEQLGLGGDTFLRAYDPSEVIGEKGAAGKAEIRYNAVLGPVQSTLYGYYDGGSVRRRQVAGPDLKGSLRAAGIGLRFSGAARLKGYVEVAKPLRTVVASRGNKDVRVFGGIGIDF
ncbi:ShlB/FhaC/HecB family hemolysin secretion/activation protein [Massilia sp. METH4]|uniref:ShlB/FhaC/HecB family hemolysin secretion/activation protein n=1 Tax=Massilia sp. METH4 TaxID=3123041 RepID=UPI0030CC1A15